MRTKEIKGSVSKLDGRKLVHRYYGGKGVELNFHGVSRNATKYDLEWLGTQLLHVSSHQLLFARKTRAEHIDCFRRTRCFSWNSPGSMHLCDCIGRAWDWNIGCRLWWFGSEIRRTTSTTYQFDACFLSPRNEGRALTTQCSLFIPIDCSTFSVCTHLSRSLFSLPFFRLFLLLIFLCKQNSIGYLAGMDQKLVEWTEKGAFNWFFVYSGFI